ncbi:hypothetical protein EKH57_14250 [Halorubrum sp. BOL3-1]|uniref:hypothetical protein n=1 Tax=Halorubrum sp. BOL3-1 TaxID=2497325 RepID=UPI001004D822|nr:hypothetical protein [Halorubrum sp. BOL3-1]QAU13790.1 hypothetical protein EKH57_14250 [Halorubrum sp. BOL3-1]
MADPRAGDSRALRPVGGRTGFVAVVDAAGRRCGGRLEPSPPAPVGLAEFKYGLGDGKTWS